MTDPHSSTSSSDPKPVSAKLRTIQVLVALGWTAVWLTLADVAINRLFPFPKEIGATPGKMTRYFEYGRSIEGKLARMIHPTDRKLDDPIIETGWLNASRWLSSPTEPDTEKGHDLLVAGYGMSFNNQLCVAAAEADGKITLRLNGGPAAPPNRSFRAWELDYAGSTADVAVLGVLASTVKRMKCLTGATWTYEHPAPYTFPRYSVDETGELTRTDPVLGTEKEFRSAFLKRGHKWQSFVEQLEQHDESYRSAVFNTDFSDRSSLVRLMRRAYANSEDSALDPTFYHPETGFQEDASEIKALKKMLVHFAEKCRERNQFPVVALFNDRGYSNHLDEALLPILQRHSIAVISSTEVASADDPSKFLPDGHFHEEVNQVLGHKLSQLIRNSNRPSLTEEPPPVGDPLVGGPTVD